MELKSEKGFGSLVNYAVSLVNCCRCQQLACEPVMLDCLHTCCRSCLVHGTAQEPTRKSSSKCPACCEAIHLRAITSNRLLYNYKRLLPLSLDAVSCCACDGENVTGAAFWCADCCRALCVRCYSWHNRFNHRHSCAELEVARMWPLSQLMPSGECDSHTQRITEQCFTCHRPQCFLCCAPCRTAKHDLRPFPHRVTTKYVSTAIRTVRSSQERLLNVASALRKKCGYITNRFRGELTTIGHTTLVHGRQSLSDSAVNTFDRSVGEVCVNLQRIWYMCTDVILKHHTHTGTAFSAARYIEQLVAQPLKNLQMYRESNFLKMISHRFVSSVGAMLRQRLKYWQENGGFTIDGAVSHTSDVMLRSCIGAAHPRRDVLPDPLLFTQATVSFLTPVANCNVAVTGDGHVLLAAHEHGLLVYSDRGQQLSSWRPKRRSDREDDWVCGWDDEVSCVAALSDRRAAVGVLYAQIVVLLKPSETGDMWLEDRRVAVLHSPPRRLAVHSDLLAAVEYTQDEQQRYWVPGSRQVKLLRLSSGQPLYTQSREYDIQTVAVTALCLLTSSRGPVKRNSGATPCLLDAFSHAGEFLWRHETSDEDVVLHSCVSDATWRWVYMMVEKEDWSSSRVMAISGSDGRDMREVMSSRTNGLQLPEQLSLARGRQRIVLAVLSWGREANKSRLVSLYEATSSEKRPAPDGGALGQT